MLFSAVDAPLAPFTRVDITFPGQVEIKVGADEVKANFKGLKNKPGSTRPADITDQIRKVPTYRNNIHVTYALTQKASYNDKQVTVFPISVIFGIGADNAYRNLR
jgi:E3 SUMO-protein ligase PIAS1